MKILSNVLIFFFVFTFSADAQYTDWANFTNGNEVNALAKDANYVWVGTSGGLVRIEKSSGTSTIYTKENSGIPSVDVRALTIDSAGNIWVGTFCGGLAKFDGGSNWTLFNTTNSPITCNTITDMCIGRDGALWIGQWNGLDRLYGSTWTRFDDTNSPITHRPSSVKSIACDTTGNIFVGCSSDGLAKYNGTNWVVFNRYNSGIQNDMIFDLVVDKNNTVWGAAPVCNGTGGLIKLVDTTFTVYVAGSMIENLSVDEYNNIWYTTFSSLTKFDGMTFTVYGSWNTEVTDVGPYKCLMADMGGIWYGTFPSKGVRQFDGSYYVKKHNTSKSSITYNLLNAIAVDDSAHVWISFNTQDCWACDLHKGLDKYDGNEFTNFSTFNSGIFTDSVSNVAVDNKNNVWAGTYSGGIMKYNGSTWQLFDSLSDHLPSNRVNGTNSIAFDSHGNTWVAFSPAYDSAWNPVGGGIARYDGNSWFTITPGVVIPYNTINAITIDHQDNLWIACSGKIVKYDGLNWTEFNQGNSPMGSTNFSCIAVDLNNDIWVGVEDYFSLGTLVKISNSIVTIYTPANSDIPAGYIFSLAVDDNNSLWIGMWDLEDPEVNALSKLNGSTFTNYTIFNSGVSIHWVNKVIAKNDKIYLSTNLGLVVFTDNTINTVFGNNGSTLLSDLSVFPNPASRKLTLEFNCQKGTPADLEIYNAGGELVFFEANLKSKAQQFSLELNAAVFSPGVYYCKLHSAGAIAVRKLVIVNGR